MNSNLLHRLQVLFTSENHPNESGKQYTIWDIFQDKSEILEIANDHNIDAARMTLDFLGYDNAHDMTEEEVWNILEAEYDAY